MDGTSPNTHEAQREKTEAGCVLSKPNGRHKPPNATATASPQKAPPAANGGGAAKPQTQPTATTEPHGAQQNGR